MDFVKTDYSLIQLEKEDVLSLRIIGELYIGKLHFHAVEDKLFNDAQEFVGRIINKTIIWVDSNYI